MDERIKKYFHGELDAATRLKLLREIEANDELKQQFIEYKNMYALLSLSDTVDNKEESQSGYIRFKRILKTRKTRRLFIRAARYAASIVLLIASTYWFALRQHPAETTMIANNTLYVPAGQRMQLTLQDGTKVWLNSQTTLTYPALFAGKERRVTVEGEAFFDVAKNPKQPFIVSSKGVEMKVLGTQFNVYSYPEKESVQTSLLEGSLKVYFPEKESEGITLKPEEQVIVKGEQMKIEPLPHNDYFLWKEGIYSFINEPLINILKKLELYYDVKIIVKDPSIYNWEYTGKFRQRDGIDEILHMIQRIHRFKIDKDNENNCFTLSK